MLRLLLGSWGDKKHLGWAPTPPRCPCCSRAPREPCRGGSVAVTARWARPPAKRINPGGRGVQGPSLPLSHTPPLSFSHISTCPQLGKRRSFHCLALKKTSVTTKPRSSAGGGTKRCRISLGSPQVLPPSSSLWRGADPGAPRSLPGALCAHSPANYRGQLIQGALTRTRGLPTPLRFLSPGCFGERAGCCWQPLGHILQKSCRTRAPWGCRRCQGHHPMLSSLLLDSAQCHWPHGTARALLDTRSHFPFSSHHWSRSRVPSRCAHPAASQEMLQDPDPSPCPPPAPNPPQSLQTPPPAPSHGQILLPPWGPAPERRRQEPGVVRRGTREKKGARKQLRGVLSCTLNPSAEQLWPPVAPVSSEFRRQSCGSQAGAAAKIPGCPAAALVSAAFPGAEPVPLSHLEMFVLTDSLGRLCPGQGLARNDWGGGKSSPRPPAALCGQ